MRLKLNITLIAFCFVLFNCIHPVFSKSVQNESSHSDSSQFKPVPLDSALRTQMKIRSASLAFYIQRGHYYFQKSNLDSSEFFFKIALAKSDTIPAIYNMLGQKITTLFNQYVYDIGVHKLSWNPVGFSSGTYYICMKYGDSSQTRSIMYLK